LHPVLFLYGTTYPAIWFFASFLIGWCIKKLVAGYGGGALYRKLQPMMIGLLVGEVAGAVIPMIIGTIYYFVVGRPASSFLILPG